MISDISTRLASYARGVIEIAKGDPVVTLIVLTGALVIISGLCHCADLLYTIVFIHGLFILAYVCVRAASDETEPDYDVEGMPPHN